MIFNSIRWRLQAWHGLILVAVLTGFGLSAYHVARDNHFRRIDQELGQRLMALLRPLPLDRPADRLPVPLPQRRWPTAEDPPDWPVKPNPSSLCSSGSPCSPLRFRS